jgi:hypothetical protein
MSDVVTEKLTQKVVNLVEEVTEVNILIRRLDSTKETMNKINERNDAILGSIVQIEKGQKMDEKRLAQLEAQTKSLAVQTASLMEGLEIQKQQTAFLRETLAQQKKLTEQVEQTVSVLREMVHSQPAIINGHTAKMMQEMKGRLEAATYSQVKWLLIVGSALLFVLAFLVLKH